MPVKHVDNLVCPTNSSPYCRVITISINKEVLKVIEIIRWEKGISRSELFRRAIKYYLESETDFNEWCEAKARLYNSRHEDQPPMYHGKPVKVIRRLE